MSATSRLLSASLLATGSTMDTARPSKLRLGPAGRCPGKPTLVIAIADDSGSVAAPGGADPISNRYQEMRLAFKAVADACLCRKELAAIVHFDTPHGDVVPQRLSRRGLRALDAGLRVPAGGAGISELRPALTRARALADARPTHEAVLVIFSDFELFDDRPGDLADELASFPGDVHACVLGSRESIQVDGVDEVTTVCYDDPPGAIARALLCGLTVHRKGLNRGGS